MEYILLIIVLWVVWLYLYIQLFSEKQIQRYELRSDFFNKSEFVFYQMLKARIPQNFMIFSKTRIEDFIRVKWQDEYKTYQSLRGKIKSRHVDFLICNERGNPQLVIEIDGSSHNNYDRQQRDNFLDGIYEEVWLEVMHIRVGENFEQKIQEIILKLQNENPSLS